VTASVPTIGRVYFFANLLLCGLLLACASSSSTKTGAGELSGKKSKNSIVLKGTIHLVPLEGGCWQIRLDDQTAYQLVGEDLSSLLYDGQVVELEVRHLGNVNTICMMGEAVEFVRVIKTY